MGARSARAGAPGAVTDAHPDRAAPACAPEFWAVLIAAFGLRLGVALAWPNIHWPDEIFQVMEPAHRLVFGTGAVSWEWVVGIRSWLLPGAVAALMEVGRAVGTLPVTVNFPVEAAFAAAGCVPVACAYFWGSRASGRGGGFVAAGVAAVWIDLVYMSVHPLTEIAAADCLPVALYLGLPRAGTFAPRHRLWLVGALLGLTFVLRFHLGPALAVAALGICGIRQAWPRWRAAIAGACAPVLVSSLLDWATLGTPFQSTWLNVWVNTALGVSAEAGREPFLTLWLLPLAIWGAAGFVAVAMTALLGARRLPWVLAVALAIVATHSLIPHKEYRFTYPAIVLVTILAGLGSAEIWRAGAALAPRLAPVLAPALVVLWAGLSVTIADSAIFRVPWTRERAQLDAFDGVSRRGDACGLGLLGIPWVKTPGMSWLSSRVALYQLKSAPASSAGFNYVLAPEGQIPGAPFGKLRCFAGDGDLVHLCLWRRDGGCSGVAPPLPVNWPGALGAMARAEHGNE